MSQKGILTQFVVVVVVFYSLEIHKFKIQSGIETGMREKNYSMEFPFERAGEKKINDQITWI